MNWKKVLSAIAAASALTVSAGAIDLYVDSEQLHPEVPPTAIGGHTLVPLRSIFDALGAELTWDNDTQTAAGRRGESAVEIQIGSPTAYVNGQPTALETPAQIVNGSTMVPVRFVAEGLDCIVKWDPETDGIYISTTGADPAIPGAAPVSPSAPAPASPSVPTGGGGNNFNTYNNESQQETSASYVLNTSTHKFHYPSCRSVPKIAPKNYSTSNSPRDGLIAQGYSACGICKP